MAMAAKKQSAKEPTVRLKLFRDAQKYRDDVFVSVNGRDFLIQRGVEVEVPAPVAAVLENAAAQREAADVMIEYLTRAGEAA